MKTLIVGAGAVGALFGSSLHQHGAELHFLLRPARKALVDAEGLTLELPSGSRRIQPHTVTADRLEGGYDLVVLANKAPALDSVIADISAAVGPATHILPLLNGLRHLDRLDQAFGQERVLGGIAKTIATQVSPTRIRVSNAYSSLTVGARIASQQAKARAVWQLMSEAGVDAELSERIMDDMWDKFCRMAALGAANCMLQGTVGEYMRSQAGGAIALQLLRECTDTAQAAGHPMHPQDIAGFQRALTNPHSSFNSSMYRDMRAGLPIEGDHLVGDMLRRGEAAGLACPMLAVANAVLQTYTARREA
ncbi:2-dehydropantoate 2-reductase [Pusillimonas sp.]|uniref:ketopantoate reductase family protein n=1 Tax=Pusillimonas sp. TaxID=3040095 RepID=UPI0029B63B07|nr:2-dehydropantoate 2-reductase [Pusillimonas sp.]MDX3894847.1 2-dehydropantoate 2-reductase [Pusillimonas sp.]